ncbi:glycosyltransferase family 4 protein [Nocardioides solisilvae]|uniref:glycosyltransferase family 4 protein n=1 Tax=Nocardioides solisilvae TaxID=1542435 RepID=UPI000D741040|nr:glycosyltransferase family 4 protein [Nocardioides solisilvae]
MRVAFLSWRDTLHPDGGGAEVYLERVAQELVSRGHRVTIRCAAHPGAPAREVRHGVRFSRAGGRLTVYPRGLLWLLGPGRRYDTVVDVVNGLPFAAPLVRRRGLVALVHHVHREQWHIIYPGWPGRVGWFVESRVVPRLYRRVPFLTVSEASRRDLVALGLPATAVSVARNGLDPSPVSAPEAPAPTLVVCARLVPHKRLEEAFEVLARLRAGMPALRLDVVGDGWWRAELEREVLDRGLAEAVVFHGHVDAAERDRLLARAWVHLLPSVKEGWGLSIMEAAGLGTPSVAYRSAGGVTEAIVDGETGMLADDLDGLCDATRRLILDAAERARLGSNAARRARGFTWAATADQVERLIS